jgi:hypothetical protein
VLAQLSGIQIGVGQEWSGAECNPLLLDPDALLRLELALDRAPTLQPRNTLRVFCFPAPEGTAPRPALTSGMMIWSDHPVLTAEGKEVNFPRDITAARKDGGEPDVPAADVDASGHAALLLPGPGRYQLLWCLEYPETNESFWHFAPVPSKEPQFVEVQRGNPVASLGFELDAAQLEELAHKH